MNDLIPAEFYMSQNYPNPFKEKTTIKYCVAYKTRVRIEIYNSDDEIIEKLVDEVKEAGTYEVEFYPAKRLVSTNQVSGIGQRISEPRFPETGKLFFQMKAGNYIVEKQMTVIK